MVSNLETEAAQCRQMATEYKWRAEQEIRLLQRAFYLDLHRSWLRMAIACEIEAESLQPLPQVSSAILETYS